jgi:hypothetical protein
LVDQDEEGNCSLRRWCDNCCRVKAIHMKPSLLQPLSVLGSKWDDIVMDFIVRLLTTQGGFDPIWVIVDRLTKSAHFIL